jgi:hypothetical protein
LKVFLLSFYFAPRKRGGEEGRREGGKEGRREGGAAPPSSTLIF